jgi:hypothetical protein
MDAASDIEMPKIDNHIDPAISHTPTREAKSSAWSLTCLFGCEQPSRPYGVLVGALEGAPEGTLDKDAVGSKVV